MRIGFIGCGVGRGTGSELLAEARVGEVIDVVQERCKFIVYSEARVRGAEYGAPGGIDGDPRNSPPTPAPCSVRLSCRRGCVGGGVGILTAGCGALD